MLEVFTEVGLKKQASDLLARARGTLAASGDAPMGGYVTSLNPARDTVLVTSGAATCLIILVHAKNKTGALGHYFADADPEHILAGVSQMVDALGHPEIDTIMFAAGEVGQTPQEQAAYYYALTSRAGGKFNATRVCWPDAKNNPKFGACAYLPKSEQAALFSSLADICKDQLHKRAGLALHSYKEAD